MPIRLEELRVGDKVIVNSLSNKEEKMAIVVEIDNINGKATIKLYNGTGCSWNIEDSYDDPGYWGDNNESGLLEYAHKQVVFSSGLVLRSNKGVECL